MEKQLSKTKSALLLLALFLSTCCTMGDMVIVPVFANMFEQFHNDMLVNMMMTLPGLVGLPFCYLGGWLADRINKKTLMITGFAIYAISGILGAVIVNPYYVLVMRCLCTGVAWGLTSTAAVSILASIYVDEAKRGQVVGWYNAAMAAVGAGLSFIAGSLGIRGWRAAYQTYWISIPVLILLILFIPSIRPKTAETVKHNIEKVAAPKGWSKKLIPLLFGFFFSALCYYVIAYMISLFVTDTGIGNEQFTGILSSLGTISSCVMGLCFGFVYGKFKKKTSVPSYFLLALGFALLYFFPGRTIAVICCTFMGAAWGNIYSYFFTECTVVVPAQMQGRALGIIGVVNGVASFLMAYNITMLKSIFHTDNVHDIFPVFLCIFVILGILAVLYKAREAKETAAN